jgi:hypothetical protein
MDVESLASNAHLPIKFVRGRCHRSFVGSYVRCIDHPIAVAKHTEGNVQVVAYVVGNGAAKVTTNGKG